MTDLSLGILANYLFRLHLHMFESCLDCLIWPKVWNKLFFRKLSTTPVHTPLFDACQPITELYSEATSVIDQAAFDLWSKLKVNRSGDKFSTLQGF